jgi:hypothetical protein
MPTHADGYLIPFTAAEVAAMEIENFDVRTGAHPVESRRVNENVMTRVFFVKWEERFNFIEHVLGDSALWTDAGITKLSRLLPNSTFGRHPESTQIIATRIDEIRGHGCGIDNIGQFPTYPKAKITVFYEQAGFGIFSDAGVATERERFTSRGPGTTDVEAFTLPGGAFKYTSAGGTGAHGKPIPFNISFTRPVRRFSMKWEMLPNALYTTNGALFRRLYLGTGDGIPWLGTVNSAAISFTGLGNYEAGQLLLEGVDDAELKSPLTATGLASLKWDVTFKFAYTPRGWLDLFYFDPATPADSGYYRVSNNGVHYAVAAMPDGKGLYNVRDLNDLWNPHLA